ncbi:hypothetical protein Hamer_G013076, partial [Homarus americanus]
RTATTSLTTPQAKKSRQVITLEQKIKVLEALQRRNGASKTALNGVWHNLWPEVFHDLKGFDEGKDVKYIMKLVKEVREEYVTELLVSMEDPLTSAKKHEEEEEATDKPQTVGKELTIPKLREFMQHDTSATQSALQHDPDMERSMQVVEALNRAASTYSQLQDQLIMAQQHKKITSFFHPLSSLAPEVADPSTSGQTRPSSSASRVSDVSTATPLDSDVDDELVEFGSASSEDELPN